MQAIKKIVVIGSGVMGAGIAGHIASAGFQVYLLDIVPTNAKDRSVLAKEAIAKSLSLNPENIIPGNLEDDIEALQEADWVIEVIVEKLDLKKSLYDKLEQYCSSDCIISSNTSTIPLAQLIEGRRFKQRFLITHFFNPPRYMRLLELVVNEVTAPEVIERVTSFMDVYLGKVVIKSNDRPGFIANRIGCYWLESALTIAIDMGLGVEEVDCWISAPLGIPKTGVFGLYDLIGIDTMQLIAKSLRASLHKNDDFILMSKDHPVVLKMLSEGFSGRKGKGGFYKITVDSSGNKIKEVIDLKTGEYRAIKDISFPQVGLKELINNNQYVLKLLSRVLSYAVSLIDDVSDSLNDIDQAIKLGYNWKYGPFELMDLIGLDYFRDKLKQQGFAIPQVLANASSFYQGNKYLIRGGYEPITYPEGVVFLSSSEVVFSNDSAKVLNLGDSIAAIEFTSKSAILDQGVFNLILRFFDNYAHKFKGLVMVGGSHNFSVGGDLKFMLKMAEDSNWQAIEDYLTLGQKAMLALKYSSVPVVGGLKGLALGGGV
jgi:3-hydroxyacyl-CoA dehydrogenase